MSTTIEFAVDCGHCDGEAVSRTLFLDQPEDDGIIRIDIEMSVSQSTLTCNKCGCETFIGDVDMETEPEECPGEDDEDEDDE